MKGGIMKKLRTAFVFVLIDPMTACSGMCQKFIATKKG